MKDMNAADVITEDCARSVQPGYGLEPKYWDRVIGQVVGLEISANTPVTEDVLN